MLPGSSTGAGIVGAYLDSGGGNGEESGEEWAGRHWHHRPATGTEPSVLHNEWEKAGLGKVPEGAVCLSASQILAFGKAAVRLEKNASALHERSVFKRKLFFLPFGFSLFVCFFC